MKKILKNKYVSTISFIILCIIIFLGVSLNFQMIMVNGASMNPTYNNSDLLLGQKIHGERKLKTNDIVVVDGKENGLNMYIIKRIVAIENDTVEIKNHKLYVNDKEIQDDFGKINTNMGKLTVPDNHVFIMGDNRNNSIDSRKIGTVPQEDVFAKIVVDNSILRNIGHIKDLF